MKRLSRSFPLTSRTVILLLSGFLVVPLCVAPVRAQSDSEETAVATAEGESQEATAEDSKEEGKSNENNSISLAGTFQAVDTDPISLDLEEWTTLTVAEAVEHGAEVQAGDTLIRLETDKLELAIDEATAEIETDELALLDAEIKLSLAQRSQDLALKAAADADRVAMEELKEFVTTGRQQRLQSLERSVLNARNRLEYQAEELRQLEKMYAADDLTEETEEIILKRTRDAVDAARYSLELAEQGRREGLEYGVPRAEESLKDAVARAAVALEEVRRTVPQSLKRQQLQFTKQQGELEKKRERLQRLRDDLKRMRVTAPRAGTVYYGGERRGKWADPATIEPMLQPQGTPKPKTVIVTLVQLRPLTVRVTVPEKLLRHVTPGTKGSLVPTAYPDLKLAARVSKVSPIPTGDGQFDAVLEIDDLPKEPSIVPGMKCDVTLDTSPNS